MSQNKIIFFVIIGIIFVTVFIAITYISWQDNTKKDNTDTIKIWITDGTSESYQTIIDWFKKYAPEYTKTDFIIEKQSNDADRYRQLLLNVFTEWSGPDIFMLKSGEDEILDTKIEPIPNTIIDFSDFDKRYDDIFKDLIYSTWSDKEKETFLRWVPLGYETLGIFYNKSVIREVPKTWNELENLYRTFSAGQFPTNIGLGPTYTPNMIDIIPLWFNEINTTNYQEVSTNQNALSNYLSYGKLEIGNISDDDWIDINRNGNGNTLANQKNQMIEQKFTTLDLFMQWDIAMIIWYPSLILELEKSSKRVGSLSKEDTILTERIPQSSAQSEKNIGRYTYFGISKYSKNAGASAKFLEYLMTPDAQRLFMKENPYLIPAQFEFYATAESNPLSETINRTRLWSFIPNTREKISIFQYWLKSRFEQYLREGIDNPISPDIDAITTNITNNISCEINTSLWNDAAKDCQRE